MKTEALLMLKSEEKALGLYLSSWPENLTYDEVVQRLYDNDLDGDDGTNDDYEGENDINIWEPFENHESDYVAEQIESAQAGLTDLDLVEEMANYIFQAAEGHSLDLSNILVKLKKAGYNPDGQKVT